MIAINDTTTVGEVASAVPGSVRIFQQFGIDFCCGGGKTVADACRDKGVPLESVLAGVEKVQQPSDNPGEAHWNSTSLSELIDHIVNKHHAYLWADLPRLAMMMNKVISVHGERHPKVLLPLGKVYAGLQAELEQHMAKEERILFPLIKRLEQAQATGQAIPMMPVGGPISVMEMEHQTAGDALRTMRQLTSDYRVPEDACATYRALFEGFSELEADLHQHIHLENNILFPKALSIIQ